MAKQAKIECPHCGKPIRINQIEPVEQSIINDAFESFDKAGTAVFKAMDDAFKKIFK